jgi:hypothetical protein
VTGVRVGTCVGDGACASWGGVRVGFASWGVQVLLFKSGGVQVGYCEFMVSIFRWSKPPHHVKVNPLGEVVVVYMDGAYVGNIGKRLLLQKMVNF